MLLTTLSRRERRSTSVWDVLGFVVSEKEPNLVLPSREKAYLEDVSHVVIYFSLSLWLASSTVPSP